MPFRGCSNMEAISAAFRGVDGWRLRRQRGRSGAEWRSVWKFCLALEAVKLIWLCSCPSTFLSEGSIVPAPGALPMSGTDQGDCDCPSIGWVSNLALKFWWAWKVVSLPLLPRPQDTALNETAGQVTADSASTHIFFVPPSTTDIFAFVAIFRHICGYKAY